MSTVDATPRDRVVAYLDPEVGRRLRLEKAETRRPIAEILNRIVREHYEWVDREQRLARSRDRT